MLRENNIAYNSDTVDVMIGSAQKAATSSLKALLEQHLSIETHTSQECDYFARKNQCWAEYRNRFFRGNSEITLAKLAHLTNKETYLLRLREHNPEVKIVFVLRDPMERLSSAYNMMGQQSWVDFSPDRFVQALEENEKGNYDLVHNVLIKPGDYGSVARKMLRLFDDRQIKFVNYDELISNTEKTANELISWIGLSSDYPLKLRHENAAKAVRSESFERSIERLRRSNVTKLSKKIVPYSVVNRVSQSLAQLNRKEAVHGSRNAFPPNVYDMLSSFYETADEEFMRVTGMPPYWIKN